METKKEILNKVWDDLEKTRLTSQISDDLINDVVDSVLEAINYAPCCLELPTKKEIIFDDSLKAEIETTDKNLKVLRAVNGWGQAINITNVQIKDK